MVCFEITGFRITYLTGDPCSACCKTKNIRSPANRFFLTAKPPPSKILDPARILTPTMDRFWGRRSFGIGVYSRIHVPTQALLRWLLDILHALATMAAFPDKPSGVA